MSLFDTSIYDDKNFDYPLPSAPLVLEKPNTITPPHYKVGDPLEVINIIEHYNLDFCTGNTVKYVLRAGKKTDNPIEDYKKAIWYLERKIKQLENINK